MWYEHSAKFTARRGWPPGPWDDEEDAYEWVEKLAGLRCLLMRLHRGGWGGYVGVPEGHPLWGIDKEACPQQCGVEECEHQPARVLLCHGEISYSAMGFSTEHPIPLPLSGTTGLWWFGFHATYGFDYCPEWASEMGAPFADVRWIAKYKDLRYMRQMVTVLAFQLAHIAGMNLQHVPLPPLLSSP